MRIAIPILSALFLSACMTATPEEIEAQRIANTERAEQMASQMEAPMTACLRYAERAASGVQSLSQQGYVPRQSLGRTIYSRGDIYAVANTNTEKCRVAWTNAIRIAPVATSINNVMARNGYTRADNGGRGLRFSKGGNVIDVTGSYVSSQGVSQWDVIFSR